MPVGGLPSGIAIALLPFHKGCAVFIQGGPAPNKRSNIPSDALVDDPLLPQAAASTVTSFERLPSRRTAHACAQACSLVVAIGVPRPAPACAYAACTCCRNVPLALNA